MSQVVVSPQAVEDLARLIATYELPDDAHRRVLETLRLLSTFPLAGRTVERGALRFIVGPWRWLITIYEYTSDSDEVRVLTFVDGRSRSWAERRGP